MGPPASGACRRQVFRRELRAGVRRETGARHLGARDQAAGGGQDPGTQIQVGAEEVEDHVRAAARRARGHHAPVAVHHGRQVTGPLTRDLPYDMLGDRREGHRLVHREQRETVADAGDGQILRDIAQFRLTGRQPGHSGLHEQSYERLRVGGVPAPGETRQDQFPAREIAARVAQVRGHHPAHGAIQFVLAAEQPQAQRVGVQQCAQPHSRRRRSLSRNLRWGKGPVSAERPAPSPGLCPRSRGLCRTFPQGCVGSFQRKTWRLLRTSVHMNLQDGAPDQPTPSWFP